MSSLRSYLEPRFAACALIAVVAVGVGLHSFSQDNTQSESEKQSRVLFGAVDNKNSLDTSVPNLTKNRAHH